MSTILSVPPSFRRVVMAKHRKSGSSAPKRPQLTHFLCVPLVNDTSEAQLQDSLRRFKEDVCMSSAKIDHSVAGNNVTVLTDATNASDPPGNPTFVMERAIRPVGVLHLTLGVMSLDATSLALASSFLSEIDLHKPLYTSKQTADTNNHDRGLSANAEPLIVSLKSLVSMHPPHKTSILYTAPHDPTDRLKTMCEALRSEFQTAGFLVQDTRPLKLHATLVNTIYVKGRGKRSKGKSTAEKDDVRSQGHGPDAKAPLQIDARDILDRYSDFVWAENVVLDRVSICEMGAKKILDQDGNVVREEYTEIASLNLR